VERLVEKDRVRTGGVDGVPTAEEGSDVVAGPVAQVEVGTARVVGDDPLRRETEPLLERALERSLVPVAADVDAPDVCAGEARVGGNRLPERRARDVAKLAVVVKWQSCLRGPAHCRAHDNRD